MGAMENWGLVTFRETAVLVDPKNTSSKTKQWVSTFLFLFQSSILGSQTLCLPTFFNFIYDSPLLWILFPLQSLILM